jgi:hypothetical protein
MLPGKQRIVRIATTLAGVMSVTALSATTALARPAAAPFITDTLAPGGHSIPAAGYPFTTDTLAPGGGMIVSATTRGFDWADAGVGAAGTAGVLVSLLGSGRVLLRHRRCLAAA